MSDADSNQTEPRVIETASGTTSPHNSDSGAGAYIIFAVAAALLLLTVTGFVGCTSSLVDFALSLDQEPVYYHNDPNIDQYLDDLFNDTGLGNVTRS